MVQRYIVFLNQRAVTIQQDIKMSECGSDEIVIDFKDKPALEKVYKEFCQDSECLHLKINAGEKFTEACAVFNSIFKRIEAAGGIVRNRKSEYLFIKRLGVWDLPKGKLHKIEPVEKGALREVKEETGLNGLLITKRLPSTYHIYTDRKGNAVLKETYWFEMMCHHDQNLVPQLEEDITEVKWFSANDLHIPLQNTYASIKKLFEGYL
jgi:ADP-ribose pyrophosphatase YjhB (NUDIX family)